MSLKSNLYFVILAGGSGTRFWPLSRAQYPKQFLVLTGQKTMLQETVERIKRKASGRNILIVTNKRFKNIVSRQTAEYQIPPKNILYEPSGKNTAPAIAWAASIIHNRDPNAVMVVLPSDHLIQRPAAFLKVLDQAVVLASRDYLVTLGIVPTRPETGYGYIKGKKVQKHGTSFLEVDQFVEKPVLAQAQKYVKAGKYFWNSGMFIWKVSAILEEFERLLPQIQKAFTSSHVQNEVEKFWNQLPAVSIDYGIMEKAKRVAVVAAGDIAWSDVGSWQALWEVSGKSATGNVFKGDVLQENSQKNLVLADQRLVALIGIQDLVVVDTKDALLICRKDDSQAVKTIVDALKHKKRPEI